MPITALPTPPSRQDPANFNDRADNFLGALPLFQTEANALETNVNTREQSTVAASNAALAAVNVVKWVSGTTYAEGAVVWSPINALGYRRITASGSGTTDPSLDTTNYKQVNGTGDMSVVNNLSGLTNISTARTNLEVASATGSGASGTWGISITGNAATVSDNSVTTAKILDDSVTTAKIVNFNVTADKIGTAAVTAAKLSGVQSGTAPIYGARAWVNFNGTGTVAMRASGNVSSITDNGTGDYTVNFTTAMPDSSYAVTANSYAIDAGTGNPTVVTVSQTNPPVAASCRILTKLSSSSVSTDRDYVYVAIHR